MIVKLLTEHHLKFISLKGGCRGLSDSTLFKMSNCWKPHAAVIFISKLDMLNHIAVSQNAFQEVPYYNLP